MRNQPKKVQTAELKVGTPSELHGESSDTKLIFALKWEKMVEKIFSALKLFSATVEFVTAPSFSETLFI